MTLNFAHTPVLLAEVCQALQPKPGALFVDGTIGGGGHATELIRHIQPNGYLIGIDSDPAALQAARAYIDAHLGQETTQGCYTLVHGNFRDIAAIVQAQQCHAVDGILLDIGVSSYQLNTPERGFSFQADGPLDMRLDPTQAYTAADLVNSLDEQELAHTIYHYGEERHARRIARAIVERRRHQPIETTGDLCDIVVQTVQGKHKTQRARAAKAPRWHGSLHPATRTFQAVRIAVNHELDSLEQVLPQAVSLLRRGGRVAVISFHSLEDRIVKQFFRAESGYGMSDNAARPVRLQIMTKKPLMASEDEQQSNPRSRSAKLRVAERI